MDRLERALEAAIELGASYAEARYRSDEEVFTYMRGGTIHASGVNSKSGFSVRVVVNGAWGFASTNRVDMVEEAVREAVKLAKASSSLRRRPVKLAPTAAYSVRYTHLVKEPITLENMAEFLRFIDSTILETDGRIKVRNISMSYTTTRTALLTSDGTSIESEIPRTSLFIIMAAHDPTKGTQERMLELGYAGGYEALVGNNVDAKIEEEARVLAKILDTSRPLPHDDVMDIIFGPELAGILVHESVGHPLELDRIMGREGAEAGESYLTVEGIGRFRLGSEEVNIVDDPTLPGSYGFYMFDEEGIKARARGLVVRGVVTETLMNREYAAYIGADSNAAARSSDYDREPIPRMANTYLKPGNWKAEEIVRDTKRGLYFKTYREWNIDDRRWFGRYGGHEVYYVENGEIRYMVRNPFIEVTTDRLWSSVDAVGDDLQFVAGECGKGNPMQGVPVWMGGPTFRARGLRVLKAP